VLWGKTLKADTPEFSTTIIFVSTAKENEGLCTGKCLACLYEHLGTGFDPFLNRKVNRTDKC
jgi:muramoyltetrapeptide carboxypeptidase LdcA involved in peptidoglycan recycling